MRLVDITITGMDEQDAREFAEEAELPRDDMDMLVRALERLEVHVDLDTGILFAVNGKILDTAENYEGP